MAQVFLRALEEIGVLPVVFNKAISKRAEQLRTFSPSKVVTAVQLARRARTLSSSDLDLAVCFISASTLGFVADAAALSSIRRSGLPYLLYFHGRGFQRLSRRNPVLAAIVRRALAPASLGVVLGNALIDDVAHALDRRRCIVIPNCILDEPLEYPERPKRATTIIGYLANLVDTKGADDLVLAVQRARARGLNVKLRIAGAARDAGFDGRLNRLVDTAGRGDLVEMVGPVFGEEKDAFLRSIDVFAFPTKYPLETFGLVNIEAMRYALPVVSTSIGAIPEIVRDGKDGFIVAPGDIEALADRIERLAIDVDLRLRLGGSAWQRFADEYTFERYKRRWENTLNGFSRVAG